MNRISRLIAHAAKPVVVPKTTHTFTEYTPLEYLQIDVASQFGLDKISFEDRIQWTQDNREAIVLMLYEVEAAEAEGRKRRTTILDQAETPATFYAACAALQKASEGKPTAHPISLDATASGIQLLAILAGCRQTAEICNVLPTGHREDAYTNVYQEMVQRIGTRGTIDRKEVKKALMTAFYGSTRQPKEVFGEGALLEIFYETVQEKAPGAWALNLELPGLWNPEALSHNWILPDNFHCQIKVEAPVKDTIHVNDTPLVVTYYTNRPIPESRSLCPNLVHSVDGFVVREMHRRCSYEPEDLTTAANTLKKYLRGHLVGTSTKTKNDKLVQTLANEARASGFLSARIISCLSQENIGHLDHTQIKQLRDLVYSLPKKPFPMMSIHDAFRCHPNYGNDLRKQYLRVLRDLAASDVLAYLVSQLTGVAVTYTKMQNFADEILTSNYALS